MERMILIASLCMIFGSLANCEPPVIQYWEYPQGNVSNESATMKIIEETSTEINQYLFFDDYFSSDEVSKKRTKESTVLDIFMYTPTSQSNYEESSDGYYDEKNSSQIDYMKVNPSFFTHAPVDPTTKVEYFIFPANDDQLPLNDSVKLLNNEVELNLKNKSSGMFPLFKMEDLDQNIVTDKVEANSSTPIPFIVDNIWNDETDDDDEEENSQKFLLSNFKIISGVIVGISISCFAALMLYCTLAHTHQYKLIKVGSSDSSSESLSNPDV